MHPVGAVVNFKRFGGTTASANILVPSERGVDYRTITYERSGTVATHDCAPIARMSMRVVYGDWQMFLPLPTESCTSSVIFLRKTVCHRGWSSLSSPLPSLLPKLPNLVPYPQPRVQPNLLPRWQPRLQPSLQLESPFLWPLVSMCSSSESNTPARKVAHRAYFSVELNTHPISGLVLLFMCLCVCASCFVSRALCRVIGGAREPSLGVIWGMFPRGCEETAAHDC